MMTAQGGLLPRTRRPLGGVTAVLTLPPRHPRAIPIRRRGERIRLEAEVLGCLGDAVDEEVLVLVIAVLAHDGAELGQLAVQDARDRIPLVHHDLVQPVGKQRDVGRERGGRTHDVRARVHGREVEDVRGRDQDLGQEGVHGDPEDQREAAEPDPLPLGPGAHESPSGATRSRRRSTPTRPPTPRGSVTSRQTTTRSSSPRAWARRPRTRASRPRALPRTNKSHGQGHRPKTALSYSSESIRSRTSCDGVVPRS